MGLYFKKHRELDIGIQAPSAPIKRNPRMTTANIDQLFAGMQDAKVFGHGNFMQAGSYKVRIKTVKAQPSAKVRGETFFVCEFEIVESSNLNHGLGTVGTWLPKFSQQSTFGNIKELMFAILGMHGANVPDSDKSSHELATALAAAACGSDNWKSVLKAKHNIDDVAELVDGAEVLLTCAQIKTRANTDFTRYQWAPVPANA